MLCHTSTKYSMLNLEGGHSLGQALLGGRACPRLGRADVKVLGENNKIWEKGCTSLRDVLLIMGSSQGAKSNSGGLIADKIVFYIHSIISDTYRELVGSFVTLPLAFYEHRMFAGKS